MLLFWNVAATGCLGFERHGGVRVSGKEPLSYAAQLPTPIGPIRATRWDRGPIHGFASYYTGSYINPAVLVMVVKTPLHTTGERRQTSLSSRPGRHTSAVFSCGMLFRTELACRC